MMDGRNLSTKSDCPKDIPQDVSQCLCNRFEIFNHGARSLVDIFSRTGDDLFSSAKKQATILEMCPLPMLRDEVEYSESIIIVLFQSLLISRIFAHDLRAGSLDFDSSD